MWVVRRQRKKCFRNKNERSLGEKNKTMKTVSFKKIIYCRARKAKSTLKQHWTVFTAHLEVLHTPSPRSGHEEFAPSCRTIHSRSSPGTVMMSSLWDEGVLKKDKNHAMTTSSLLFPTKDPSLLIPVKTIRVAERTDTEIRSPWLPLQVSHLPAPQHGAGASTELPYVSVFAGIKWVIEKAGLKRGPAHTQPHECCGWLSLLLLFFAAAGVVLIIILSQIQICLI